MLGRGVSQIYGLWHIYNIKMSIYNKMLLLIPDNINLRIFNNNKNAYKNRTRVNRCKKIIIIFLHRLTLGY